ncbi:nucleotide sugar dehydrogenase [Vibrio cholerae]|nr:nucleotide sugar dehydrogenase [Vibrio cholerae]EGR4348156.1 nucleotide sugar dehydrogenase [Vibrio cholerae]
MKETNICVVGLGYVGLPLAVEFGKYFDTIGFDIDKKRITELSDFIDLTKECSTEHIQASKKLIFTSELEEIKKSNVYIVTVPTPIDRNKHPDLTPLIKASEMISEVIKHGDIVIYESTVYPGATEEVCIPIIENKSGLKFNKDFFAGYSPERINPGDKINRLPTIKKITSGCNENVAEFIDNLYSKIIIAGTHKASSIKVAEAAKVIENIQRDVNIALINELHQVFEKMNINTEEVIEAASTKWNFMKLMPGLVGGHCIGVDPYYLLHKSKSIGYIPDLIRKAREINDGMSEYVGNKFISYLVKHKLNPSSVSVLMLGFTFKENCPDIRNTKIVDVYNYLIGLGVNVDIYDPVASSLEVNDEYGIKLIDCVDKEYDVGFVAVKHDVILSKIDNKEITFSTQKIFDYRKLEY